MEKEYDYAAFIGRFQPFHSGHLHVVNEGLKIARKVVIVVGSPNVVRDARNPWSFEERVAVIENSISPDGTLKPVYIVSVPDMQPEKAWEDTLRKRVGMFTTTNSKVALIGHSKDATSYYLNSFPEWDMVHIEPYEFGFGVLSATMIREDIAKGRNVADGMMVDKAREYLMNLMEKP